MLLKVLSANVKYPWIMQRTLHSLSVHVVTGKVRERLPYYVEYHSIVMRKSELTIVQITFPLGSLGPLWYL